jgi:hypothetical protein
VTGGARPPRSTPSATRTTISATISWQPAISNKPSKSIRTSAISTAKPPTAVTSAMPFHAAGNTTQARNNWQLALSLLDQLSDVPRTGTSYADADSIRAKLGHG